MKLFIDIDGVLLRKNQQAAPNLLSLLTFSQQNFECFWLTTHCKGDAQTAVRYLCHHVGSDMLPFIMHIQPTYWDTLKTEAIDFQQPFYWLGDYALLAEKQALMKNKCLDRLIDVNLRTEGELQRIMSLLWEKLKKEK